MMSHIPTTAHPGRAGFSAVAQPNLDDELHMDDRYSQGGYSQGGDSRFSETSPPYDGRQYENPPQQFQVPEYRDTYESYEYTKPATHDHPVYRRTSSAEVWEQQDQVQHHIQKNPPSPYLKPVSQSPPPDQPRPNYKPTALRWPFLVALLLLLSAALGALAYGLVSLPVKDGEVGRGIKARSVDTAEGERQVEYFVVRSVTITKRQVATITPTIPSITTTEDEESTPTSPPTETPTIASSVAQEDHGNIGDITITEETTTAGTTTQGYVSPDDHGNIGPTTITEVDEGQPTPTNGAPVTVADGEPVTRTDAPIAAPTFVTPAVATLTNSEGVPTATSTSIPPPVSTPQTTVVTNELGQPTTVVTDVLATPEVSVLTDSAGVPTATLTSYPAVPSEDSSTGGGGRVVVVSINLAQYISGMYLPTIAAILLSIPIRILDLNAKIFQPWHELTQPGGASGRKSLCLEAMGWPGIVQSVRSLGNGQVLVFATTTLVLASALLIPLAAEAVRLDLRGNGCAAGNMSGRNCGYVLSVFRGGAIGTMVLLAVMILGLVTLIVCLRRWQTGVSTNPWSVGGIASLSLNEDVRLLFANIPADVSAGQMPASVLESMLEDRRFKLGYFYGAGGNLEYGIMLADHDGLRGGKKLGTDDALAAAAADEYNPHEMPKTNHHLPFLMLGYLGRALMLFVLVGMLALILYYNNTGGDTPFERFMSGEGFGVRFLFTSVGVIVTFFWSSFFDSIAVMSTYKRLAQTPRAARRYILTSPPTNAFSGLWLAIRRGDWFLALVALISIVSEVLPIFLANVPYRVTSTYIAARVCTWSATGIMAIMVLVTCASFFIKWPYMPLDPSTIAGAMYYVCDSWMLRSFEGTSTLKKKERDWKITSLGLKYHFGQITSASGKFRIGVDIAEGTRLPV